MTQTGRSLPLRSSGPGREDPPPTGNEDVSKGISAKEVLGRKQNWATEQGDGGWLGGVVGDYFRRGGSFRGRTGGSRPSLDLGLFLFPYI